MHDGETVELFLLAREDGMCVAAASAFAGVSRRTGWHWEHGELPHSCAGAPATRRIRGEDTGRRGRPMPEDRSIYEPPRSGPLAGLTPDQIESLLPGAVLADLKAVGWDPASISNRSKCELGERSRRATALPLRCVTGFLRISKSSHEYWRRRLAEGLPDRDADIRGLVRDAFEASGGSRGHREPPSLLRRAGEAAGEKRVRRVMREEGLRPAYARRRRRGWSSYAARSRRPRPTSWPGTSGPAPPTSCGSPT